MQEGTWLSSKLEDAATGSFSWVDFSPNAGGANEAADLIKGSGQCNVPAVGAQVGQQGNIESLDMAWNTRFGLYKGAESSSTATPDYTGYAYTPLNWPARFNAFGGSDGDDPNFRTPVAPTARTKASRTRLSEHDPKRFRPQTAQTGALSLCPLLTARLGRLQLRKPYRCSVMRAC
jgi:hypothetical protein